jgi:hypothetical protein
MRLWAAASCSYSTCNCSCAWRTCFSWSSSHSMRSAAVMGAVYQTRGHLNSIKKSHVHLTTIGEIEYQVAVGVSRTKRLPTSQRAGLFLFSFARQLPPFPRTKQVSPRFILPLISGLPQAHSDSSPSPPHLPTSFNRTFRRPPAAQSGWSH